MRRGRSAELQLCAAQILRIAQSRNSERVSKDVTSSPSASGVCLCSARVERRTFADHRHIGTSIDALVGFASKPYFILSRLQNWLFSFRCHFQLWLSFRSIYFAIRGRIHFQMAATFELDREENRFAADGYPRAAKH